MRIARQMTMRNLKRGFQAVQSGKPLLVLDQQHDAGSIVAKLALLGQLVQMDQAAFAPVRFSFYLFR